MRHRGIPELGREVQNVYVGEGRGGIRVLIVDPHRLVRQALRRLLESQSTLVIVGEAGDSAQALALARELQPDVVLLDFRLGSESGLDLLPDLPSEAPSARALVLTGEPDTRLHQEAVKAGAMGVVLKEKAAEVVIKAIEISGAGPLEISTGIWTPAGDMQGVPNPLRP